MTTQEIVAITRIFTDLIKADDILDISEMKFMTRMKEKYKIKVEHMIAAQKTDFANAVNVIKKLSPVTVRELLDDMRELTLTDGSCAPEEAFYVMALNLCLSPKYSDCCELISTNVTNIAIDIKNVIYIETEYDDDYNDFIRDNLRYIKNDFKLVGLEFVYIPQIAQDFTGMDTKYLHEIIEFLAPTLSVDEQDHLFDYLRRITTVEFCDEFLIKRIGLEALYDSEPSLVFPICRNNERTVYMHVTLGHDVKQDLLRFIDLYKSLTRNNASLIYNNKEDKERFAYYGFHRSLFELIAFPGEDIESRIIIDLYRRKVTFADLGEQLDLSVKQLALYILIVQQSICTKAHGLIDDAPKSKLENIERVFRHIYGMMSSSDNDTGYTAGINPALARIRKSIKSVRYLDNVRAYLPEHADGCIRVKIKPSKVYVVDRDGNLKPMIDSREWLNM
jgi:hypothetical protein